VLAVLAAAGVWQYRDVSDTQRARVDGLAAATAITPQLCTLDYRTLTRDTENAETLTAGTSPPGTTRWSTARWSRTRRSAAGDQGDARASALVSADRDEVVALVYLGQVTTSTNLTAPRLDGSGVRGTLDRVGERWLVSKLDRI
jgi:Mce-associated membrane protein